MYKRINAARTTKEGQLVLTRLAAEMFGNFPQRVVVDVEPEENKIRLLATTPDDKAGFAFTSSNTMSSFRVSLSHALSKYPWLKNRKFQVSRGGDGELILQ